MKMKSIFITLLAALLFVACSDKKKDDAAQEKIYDVAEVMPEFNGGDEALMKYLQDNVKYPEEAEADTIEGRVVVRFYIDKEGNVKEPEVIESVDSLLDKEALRVVGEMPKWTPAKQDGKSVNVYFTLPVVFKLM